jgi:hypothetical protein
MHRTSSPQLVGDVSLTLDVKIRKVSVGREVYLSKHSVVGHREDENTPS